MTLYDVGNIFFKFTVCLLAIALVQVSADSLNVIKWMQEQSTEYIPYRGVVQNQTIVEAKFVNEEESRIVGGNEVEPHSMPHQAALTIYEGLGVNFLRFCGGSLIGEVWVLTTASCVQDARSVQVILGAHDISQAETTQQNITSMDISSHPDFDPVTLQNDVAVIKLPLAAKLTKYVSPLCLVASNISIEDGTIMTAAGWGYTKDSDTTFSHTLRSVNISTISNEQCGQSYGTGSFIDDSILCAGTISGAIKGTCLGDVGGPLTITGKTVDAIPNARYCQTGIASAIAGDECESGFPTAFLRVSYFVDDFITNVTGIEPCIECSSYFQSSQSSGMINPCRVLLFCSIFLVVIFTVESLN